LDLDARKVKLSEDAESEEESDGEDYDEDDDLGEDAVDLATAWDNRQPVLAGIAFTVPL
jgi:hypothetical protein